MAVEPRRRCGYRKMGGLYLVADGLAEPCHRLPWPLDICPTCGAGIRPARAWTWVNGRQLFFPGCGPYSSRHCGDCVVCRPERFPPPGQAGLIWVGERFYPTPRDFEHEAATLGISRRLPAVPHGFRLGQTWVLLAHRRAVPHVGELELSYTPGIFRVFVPARIEKLVPDSTPEPELAQLRERGITPVLIDPADLDHQANRPQAVET